MPREVKLRQKRTRDGLWLHVLLYDDRGRFVLTSRTAGVSFALIEAVADFLSTGRVTMFAQGVIKRARDAQE
jgi:hypothetical protein